MKYIISIALPLLLVYPLSAKWEIRRDISIPWLLAMGLLSAGILRCLPASLLEEHSLFALSLAFGFSMFVTATVLLYRFFRDPDREAPKGSSIILSPADGRVIYIKEIRDGEFPIAIKNGQQIPMRDFVGEEGSFTEGVQIGIAMCLLDVHVNRAPIAGTVEGIRRIPGVFRSLKRVESLLENERVFTLIKGDELQIGVVQIASRLVRRIVCYIEEGVTCRAGQRIGMIRFGSQVDLLISKHPGLDIKASMNDEVKAGMTVLATY
jgi:phosphatidylserine decarboxylase